ncbi:hypothetical protein JNUCC0626_48725 [Lentzea sp. JNUCC 0626]|uniref:hypothetical protein n=1 Tax=Lentzea sp. JNUCC 0626 TaxID=3367513 RepID=UPI00374A10B7
MAEPIIPVRRDGSVDGWWRQVVEVAGVEGLVDVNVGTAVAREVAQSLSLPLTELKHIDRSGVTHFSTHPAALPDHFDATQVRVVPKAGSPLWQVVLGGDFTPEHEQALDGTVRYHRVQSADQVARAALLGHTFLDQTVSNFSENYAVGATPAPALIWLTAKDNYVDCLWFWNLRVLRNRGYNPAPMIIIPADDLPNWIGFARALAHPLARLNEYTPDASVTSFSVPEDKLHSLAQEFLGLHVSDQRLTSRISSSTELRVPPFTYQYNLDLRDLLLYERRYGQSREVETFVSEGRASLRFVSPVEFSLGGRTLLRMSSPLFDPLPRKDILANQIVNASTWRDDSLQIATNATNSYRRELHIPSLHEATSLLVDERTTEWHLSEKGKIADALIPDADLSILLRPSVYEAITHLTTPRSTAYRRQMEQMRASGMSDDEVQAYGARWGGRGARRYDSAEGLTARLGKNAPQPVQALESLCSTGWAERGFETACARCGLRSFVPLSTVEQVAQCPGCKAATEYTSTPAGLTLHYRLNSFIDLASDQGVVPHLLVIAALAKKHPHTHLLGGVLATFNDNSVHEIDVLGIHAQQFIAGEVKSKAREFTPAQLDRDLAVSSRLGAETHLIAAVDEIPDDTMHACRQRAEAAGLNLLVLSKQDLRPSGPPNASTT